MGVDYCKCFRCMTFSGGGGLPSVWLFFETRKSLQSDFLFLRVKKAWIKTRESFCQICPGVIAGGVIYRTCIILVYD